MKSIQSKTIGCNFTLMGVPETLAEALTLGANEKKVVAKAVDHELYHVYLGKLRDSVCESLEESTEVMMKTQATVKKDGTLGKPKVIETAQDYVKRLIDESYTDQSDVDAKVRAYIKSNAFKFTTVDEKVSVARKKALDAADVLLKDAGRMEKFVAKCEEFEIEVGEGVDRESLADTYQSFFAAINAKALEELE